MSHAALFAVALLARGLAVVAWHYSDWLLRLLMEGCHAAHEVLLNGSEFLVYLTESITHQVFGSPSNY